MNSRILVTVVTGLIAFGFIGTNHARDTEKPSCPPSYQSFAIHAFTEAEAIEQWPTGAEAYATQEDAAVDYPERSLEAFVWSNLVVKDGFLDVLESADRDGDGMLCVKYTLAAKRIAKLYPDYDPLYLFSINDQGR